MLQEQAAEMKPTCVSYFVVFVQTFVFFVFKKSVKHKAHKRKRHEVHKVSLALLNDFYLCSGRDRCEKLGHLLILKGDAAVGPIVGGAAAVDVYLAA